MKQMNDLRPWLKSIGLDQYADLFAAHDIDPVILPDLRDDEFEKLGVSLGHRKKLIKAATEHAAATKAAGRLEQIQRLAESPDTKAERRHLTVLFCDMIGSTGLAARLDPEDMRGVLLEFQKCCADAIRQFDGHIARYMGDGVLAYFGFPAAHEDDAERAVNTALRLLDSVSAMALPDGQQIELRIGIATGLVVVGDVIGEGASQEFALVGEAPNLAARLQQIAQSNQIVVAPSTRRLLGKRFELEDMGEHALKGLADPVRAWRIVQPSAVENRFSARQSEHLTSFVGRDSELGLLLTRYRTARRGNGQLVLISGEPGIGKSRLMMALQHRLEADTSALVFQCSPYHTSSAWFPVIRHLEEAIGTSRETSAALKLEKLEELAGRHLRETGKEIVPILAALLSLPTGDRYPPLALTPAQLKIRTFNAVLELIQSQAAEQPAILLFEDVHWIDPTSLELLERLRDQVRSWRILIILSLRPEVTLPWTDQPHITSLTLSRLDSTQVASMIESLSEEYALSRATTDQILAKTDGVPLFVEEVTKAVLEAAQRRSDESPSSADGPITLAVPDTLHDSLMARLDQVAPMKAVAQMAAVIGREFSYEVLQAIAPIPERDVRSAIDRLLSTGLVFRSGPWASESFTFKHALVRDEAYASLLRVERRALHGKIADALVTRFAPIAQASPELVAYHYAQGGNARAAIDQWLLAARHAGERSAFVEASRHLKAALGLLAELPADRERDTLELRLQQSLGAASAAGRGFSADETRKAFKRALELCDRYEPSAQVFPILNGLIGVHVAAGEFEESRDLAEDLLARARRQDDPTANMMGHRALGMSLFLIGDISGARVELQPALDLYDVTRHAPLAPIFSQDFKVSAQSYMGLASVLFGDIDTALEGGHEAVAHADTLRHPPSVCYALTFLAGAHLMCRNVEPVYPLLARSVGMAAEYDFALWTAAGQMLSGWARLQTGDPEQALAETQQSLVALEATGALIWVQFSRYLLAAALFKTNRLDEAIGVADQELTKITSSTSGRWYEAELYRIKGSALRARGAPDAAMTAYEQAIATAKRQSALLWQLRAENDVATLLRTQGKFEEARTRLAPLHARFAGAAAYPDVVEAGSLLAETA